MSFTCKTCTYNGVKLDEGRCPACGSANIVQNGVTKPAKKEDKYQKLKTGIMIIAWLAFAFELFRLLSK